VGISGIRWGSFILSVVRSHQLKHHGDSYSKCTVLVYVHGVVERSAAALSAQRSIRSSVPVWNPMCDWHLVKCGPNLNMKARLPDRQQVYSQIENLGVCIGPQLSIPVFISKV
jgi:hypothetical protein